MKDFLTSLISDIDDSASSKRFVLLISFMAFIITWFSNLYFGFLPADIIVNSLMYIIIGTTGIVGLEKFAPRK